jgi:hypothetical protein
MDCMKAGCQMPGECCEYVDGHGRPCLFVTCAGHRAVVDGKGFCDRHATALQGLAKEEGLRPDLTDRNASLVAWVSRDLDIDIHEMLTKVQLEEGGQVVSSPVVARFSNAGQNRTRRWQRDWKLIDHTGILVYISIAADQETPGVVIAMVDGQQLARLVPPWITHRAEGAQHGFADRAIFYSGLRKSIEAGMEARKAFRPRAAVFASVPAYSRTSN